MIESNNKLVEVEILAYIMYCYSKKISTLTITNGVAAVSISVSFLLSIVHNCQRLITMSPINYTIRGTPMSNSNSLTFVLGKHKHAHSQ